MHHSLQPISLQYNRVTKHNLEYIWKSLSDTGSSKSGDQMVEGGRARALTFYYISFGPVVNFFYITPFQSGPLSLVLASGNYSLTSCHSFASSRISYKWSYSACPLLCLASFTLHNAVEIHLYCCTCRQLVHCC